jgi:DNA-binding beta-propeller fold protein YncE
VNGDADTVSSYTVGPGGQLAPLGDPVATGEEPFGIAIAPGGRTVYVANHETDSVSVLAVDRRGGLEPRGSVPSGASSPKGVAVTPDGRHLFVAHGRPTDTDPDFVTMFDVHRDGSLTLRARTPIGESGQGVAVSPDGRFLYVACQGSDEVFGFRIGQDGELTPVPGSPVSVPRFAESPVVTPDGRALYVGSVGQAPMRIRAVSAFTIGSDGRLAPVPGTPFDAGLAPAGVIPTPDGRHLYVGNFTSNDVSGFDIGPDGVLMQVAGSPFPTGGDAPSFQGIGVLPNQGPTASFSARGHGVVRFDRNGLVGRRRSRCPLRLGLRGRNGAAGRGRHAESRLPPSRQLPCDAHGHRRRGLCDRTGVHGADPAVPGLVGGDDDAEGRRQPRPMNGIFVAMTVRNWTLASSGRLAM